MRDVADCRNLVYIYHIAASLSAERARIQSSLRQPLRTLPDTMCVGENCAPQAAQYVNAQLTVLHANAASCFKEHGNAQRSEDHFRAFTLTAWILSDVFLGYGHALYDFAYGKVAKRRQTKPGYDTLFHATFDKPEIEFICNHDAILRIKTTCGHYYAEPFNHSISSKSPVRYACDMFPFHDGLTSSYQAIGSKNCKVKSLSSV